MSFECAEACSINANMNGRIVCVGLWGMCYTCFRMKCDTTSIVYFSECVNKTLNVLAYNGTITHARLQFENVQEDVDDAAAAVAHTHTHTPINAANDAVLNVNKFVVCASHTHTGWK